MDRIWWQQIIKPNRFVEQVVRTLSSGKSILLCVPEDIPWENTLHSLIEEKLQEADYDRTIDTHQCPAGNIGEYLLESYCKKES